MKLKNNIIYSQNLFIERHALKLRLSVHSKIVNGILVPNNAISIDQLYWELIFGLEIGLADGLTNRIGFVHSI